MACASAGPRCCVPGYTGSKEDFLPVLEPLAAAGRLVVAMDLRGQYQSPPPPTGTGYAPDRAGRRRAGRWSALPSEAQVVGEAPD